MDSMDSVDSCEKLYTLIFNLPQQPSEILSMVFLGNRI